MYLILDLETHGTGTLPRDGVGMRLVNGEVVRWEEILPELEKLNIILDNKLILISSMCIGNSIIEKIDYENKAPFKLLIGPYRIINESTLLNRLKAFFNEFLSSSNIYSSIIHSNKKVPTPPPFDYIKSDECIKKHFDPDRDKKNFQEQVREQAQKKIKTNPKYSSKSFEEVQQETEVHLRSFYKSELHRLQSNFNME